MGSPKVCNGQSHQYGCGRYIIYEEDEGQGPVESLESANREGNDVK